MSRYLVMIVPLKDRSVLFLVFPDRFHGGRRCQDGTRSVARFFWTTATPARFFWVVRSTDVLSVLAMLSCSLVMRDLRFLKSENRPPARPASTCWSLAGIPWSCFQVSIDSNVCVEYAVEQDTCSLAKTTVTANFRRWGTTINGASRVRWS